MLSAAFLGFSLFFVYVSCLPYQEITFGGASVERIVVGLWQVTGTSTMSSFEGGEVIVIGARKVNNYGVGFQIDHYNDNRKLGRNTTRLQDWRCWAEQECYDCCDWFCKLFYPSAYRTRQPPTGWYSQTFQMDASWVQPVRIDPFPDIPPGDVITGWYSTYFWHPNGARIMYCRSQVNIPNVWANGKIEYPELCDDGNYNDRDGCTWGMVDSGYYCPIPGAACKPCPLGSGCTWNSTSLTTKETYTCRAGCATCIPPRHPGVLISFSLDGLCTSCKPGFTLQTDSTWSQPFIDNWLLPFYSAGRCVQTTAAATEETTVSEQTTPDVTMVPADSVQDDLETALSEDSDLPSHSSSVGVPGWAVALLVLGSCVFVLLLVLVGLSVTRRRTSETF